MSYPETSIDQAFDLLPSEMDTPAARVILAAIGYQESDGYAVRRQYGNGPAAGYWQFERGGIKGVMLHKASARLAMKVCEARGVDFNSEKIWEAFQVDDVLAAAFARLLMWTDSKPLPDLGDVQGAWKLYSDKARTWSPGKPHPDKWPVSYAFGMRVCGF